MRNEELSEAATDLCMALERIIEIYARLEDDDGSLGRNNHDMEKQFGDVMEWLEGLAIFVHEADPHRAKRQDTPPWFALDAPEEIVSKETLDITQESP